MTSPPPMTREGSFIVPPSAKPFTISGHAAMTLRFAILTVPAGFDSDARADAEGRLSDDLALLRSLGVPIATTHVKRGDGSQVKHHCLTRRVVEVTAGGLL